MAGNNGPAGTHKPAGRRVMVVADPTRESAAALQYALAHAILENDELILIHVMSPCPRKATFSLYTLSTFFRKQQFQPPSAVTAEAPTERGGGGSIFGGTGSAIFKGSAGLFGGAGLMDSIGGGKDGDFLTVMKKACEAAHPNMKVQVEKVEQGVMDKATAVLSQTKSLAVDLLIIGQRRNLSNVFLGARKNGGPLLGGPRVVDTAEFLIENSLCTCVGVQKKSQNAGYLLNTRTHKNFWLLA